MFEDIGSLVQLLERFPTEQSCIDYLTKIRFKNGAFCPNCGGRERIYHFSDGRRHKCGDCKKQFTTRIGTVFEGSNISLKIWFMAIYLFVSHRKGIPSTELAREIGVTQKTAWFMLCRIRKTMESMNNGKSLSNRVEIDETYVGGKEKNKHANKRTNKTQGRSTKTKAAIFGMMQRGGEVRAFHLKKISSHTVIPKVLEHVNYGTTIYTDEFIGYKRLSALYNHNKINHSLREYVRGDVHTNSIESFWALFKRGFIGVYHWMSFKHMQRYVDEFVARWNLRLTCDGQRLNSILLSSDCGRLYYKDLIK